MLLKIHEFRRRVAHGMDELVSDLQHLTHRFGFAEAQAWRSSFPRLSVAFSDPSFEELDLYFSGEGSLSLEYRLPACGSWADMVLLGRHGRKSAAVIVELKDWITQGDLPGPGEGLIQRPGRVVCHPSDQVRGYVEWCRRFHSAVQEQDAQVHGCVVFTKDPYYASYNLSPNDSLTREFPCFSVEPSDIASRFPAFFRDRLTSPDRDFAESFEKGVYTQARGFVQFIGQQILEPKKSPFVLLDNQRRAFALVRARVEAAATSKSRPAKTIILVEGPPGSGKSVVAAQVWAALVTHPKLPPRQRGHYDHIGKPEFKLEIPF